MAPADSPAIATYRRLRHELQTGAISPGTCSELLAAFDRWEAGEDLAQSLGLVGDPTRYSRNARHGSRLADRDEALRTLATRATGSTWRQAQSIATWQTRRALGDSLAELPADTGQLLAVVGDLSTRQIFRVLGGDRSA
jgi:hypothetical protein